RRNVDIHSVTGHRTRRRLAVVREIRQVDDGPLFPGGPVEPGFLGMQRILEGSRHIRREISFLRVIVEELKIVSFDLAHTDWGTDPPGARRATHQRQCNGDSQTPLAHAPSPRMPLPQRMPTPFAMCEPSARILEIKRPPPD